MRKLAFLFALVLAAGAVLAQEPPPAQPPAQQPSMSGQQPPAAESQRARATKEVSAQVVSADPTGKTITVKREDPSAGESTLPVEAEAVTALKTVKPGEKVRLVCRTDSSGKETAVTQIIQKTDKPPKTNNPPERP